jgi:hypothetical protein
MNRNPAHLEGGRDGGRDGGAGVGVPKHTEGESPHLLVNCSSDSHSVFPAAAFSSAFNTQIS